MPIEVLLIDDSAILRKLVSKELELDPDIKVVATAIDGKNGIELAELHKPRIIVLDVEMPIMDGIEALPFLLKASPGVRIIMASRLTHKGAEVTLQALELGASDFIPKPNVEGIQRYYQELRDKVKALGAPKRVRASALSEKPKTVRPAPINPTPQSASEKTDDKTAYVLKPESAHAFHAIAIASSTGGPNALATLFSQLKGRMPQVPIFITQHMPSNFTSVLAERIANVSGVPCMEGTQDMLVEAGKIYIAPGGFHMVVKERANKKIIQLTQEAEEHFCRPAADPMFRSLSPIYGKNLFAMVLTGMGKDGAAGAKIIADNGGAVIVQDEETSIVFGMPRAALNFGICQAVLPLDDIAGYVLKQFR